MNLPEELKYTKEHEWVKILEETAESGNPLALVGITDFAQSELGELVYVEIETVGESINRDDVFGTVEAVKTTSDLFMPVDGTILEFNPALNEAEGDNPTLLNEDPYGEGWIVKIEITDPGQLEALLSAETYKESIS